ncbi:MAG: hypothetical protein HC915_05995 [Anaerolineae bacterium]|nr:hypothetical protein [Anaerolineae bacterium]
MDTYGRQVPIYDQWQTSVFVAVAAENGTLDFEQLLARHNGHRIFFTNLITLGATWFTDWNTDWELWVNLPLALGNLALLVALFWRQAPDLLPLALVPFSALVFSLYQDISWTTAFQSQWHIVTLFFLAALLVLTSQPPGWWAWGGAAWLSVGATFSFGSGFTAWPILGVVLWLVGYRQPVHYLLWAALGALNIWLYFQGDSSQAGLQASALDDPGLHLRYVLAFFGSPLGYRNLDAAAWIGAVGLGLFAVHILWLWHHSQQNWAALAPWLAIGAYVFGLANSTGLSRVGGRESELYIALSQRYTQASVFFWAALLALVLLVGRAFWRESRRWQRAVVYGQVILGVMGALLYLRTNAWSLQYQHDLYGTYLGHDYGPREFWDEELCVVDYPLYRDSTCSSRRS